MKIKKAIGIAFIVAGIGLVTWTTVVNSPGRTLPVEANRMSPSPSWQAEPVIPTAHPISRSVSTPTMKATPTFGPQSALQSSSPAVSNQLERFGVTVSHPPLEAETVETLGFGWYLTWSVVETPPRPGGVEFWQMIRLSEAGYRPDNVTIQQAARANPGTTWLIGNEPDVKWQDNVTPKRYAELYHQLYHILKEADPTARVAIGGVTQPTPLRLQYLELILSSYQAHYDRAMPIDVWNIHNFILREERGSWGVDIPPGLEANHGLLFEVDDHDDLEVFQAQLINFRKWMADHNQRDKPLIVSEYGVLMPPEYGFRPERTRRFLYGTYEFMLSATDEQIGYPADGNRLVQRWAWYSLNSSRYPTGNFIDVTTGKLTALGQAHQKFVTALP